MAKSKLPTHGNKDYSKIKRPVKPKWMRVTKVIAIIVMSALMLLAIAGIMIKYYRLVSKH